MKRSRVAKLISFVAAFVVASMMLATDPVAVVNDPDEQIDIAGLRVAVWKPSSGSGRFPLVLFSHGLFGCKTQSNYLLRALANRGMLVAAPDHKDMSPICPQGLSPTSLPLDLISPLHWNPALRKDRRDDIRALRTALEASAVYGPSIDPNRAALVGHSLGGYTALGLAGAWPSWRMDRLTAVVALASYARPLLIKGELDEISVPVMVQGGDRDRIAPAEWQELVYDKVEAPGCKVIYEGARHFAWTALDTIGDYHHATAAAAAGFLAAAFAGRIPTTADLPSSSSAPTECK